MNYFKTVETITEPAFIITNDLGEYGCPNTSVLLMTYWYQGDDEWGIAYNPLFNDSPLYFTQYGEPRDHLALDKVHVAMFYALLEQRGL